MRAVALVLALLAAPAIAQAPASAEKIPACDRQATVPGFEAWGGGPASDALAIGRPASLKLIPAATVAGTFGGAFPLHIDKAGRYDIALGAPAWIDVVAHGTAISSIDHRKGEPCSGIAKIVTFALMPGEYVVQLSEAKADGVLAMVGGR